MRIHLGTGVLTWKRDERVSDRYGSVYLIADGRNSLTREPCPSLVNRDTATFCCHREGALIAVVIEARASTHVGDFVHSIFPETPEVGEAIVLGTGTFFTENAPEGGLEVGLEPDDEREFDWLDPRKLYRAHEQIVTLFFEEKP